MITLNSISVTVLLVNWNNHQDTITCLESVERQCGVRGIVNVVIVDNGSCDGSVTLIHRYLISAGWNETMGLEVIAENQRIQNILRFNAADRGIESILLVKARANYGFAAGNNIGRYVANELWKSEFFWLLNSDTQAAPDALRCLLAKMDQEKNIAICGSTILYADGNQRVQCYGGALYSLKTGRAWAVGMDEMYNPFFADSAAEAEINYISGASMLIRESIWHKTGPLCEDYFLYNEEVDFALRLSKDQRLGVAVKAIVFHKVGASIGTDKGRQIGSRLSTFFQTRSKLLFAGKHTPKYWPLVWLTLLARAVKLMKNPYARRNAMIILMVLVGRRKVDASWFEERQVRDSQTKRTSDIKPRI